MFHLRRRLVYCDTGCIICEDRINPHAALDSIGDYYDENHLRANPDKTQTCVFHLRNRKANRQLNISWWIQTTQPTSGGAVTADSSCCANCVEPPRPQEWGPDLPFFGHAGHADPLDGWRCCSQKQVMSRPIQVRQL